MKKNQRAFTLIELLVTISILSVLLMLAAPSFVDFHRSSTLTSQVNNLVSALHMARNEAIKHNTHSYLVPLANNSWSSGWMLFADTDMSGVYEEANDSKILEYPHFSDQLELTANGNTANDTSARYISFNASGYPRTKANAMANFSMAITVSGAATDANTRRIIVSKTGRIRTCRPDTDSTCTSNASD